MQLLFSSARSFHPWFRSGADLANHEYLAALVRRGFDCRVLGLRPPGTGPASSPLSPITGPASSPLTGPASSPLTPSAPAASSQTSPRYRVDGIDVELLPDLQSLLDRTLEVVRLEPPDLFLTACPGDRGDNRFEQLQLEAVARAGLPAALLVHDLVETPRVFGEVHTRFRTFIANSRYVADELRRLWDIDAEVVYPVPAGAHSRVPDGAWRGGYLTMFNPIQPKGVRTTLLLAAFHLRDRRFQLVEGWLTFAEIGLRDGTFPNVTLQPRTADVGSIYARTDCLLVPSVWQEPFGRVVLEALQNGLPVAASAVGGIPEVMAGSPLLIQAYEDPEAWARALRSLDDPSAVAELRAWSLERASSFDHEREMDRLAELLRLATAARAPE